VLSIDRPGHGLSDHQPGRTLLGWSQDVADFADALDLESFAIMGWSGGGPYVLACAAGIPDRLTAAAVLSGTGQFETRESRRAVSSLDRKMLALSTRSQLAARMMMKPIVVGVRRAPNLALKSFEDDLSPSDIETFRRLAPDPKTALTFFLEAFRSGTVGVVEDYRVLASPWEFAPEDIGIPVHFWHGDADKMAALSDAQAIAQRMPSANFTVVPGAGHLLLMNHADEIFATLAS
jgi:pimeloyl-ACP methyl ester carboxylesterase